MFLFQRRFPKILCLSTCEVSILMLVIGIVDNTHQQAFIRRLINCRVLTMRVLRIECSNFFINQRLSCSKSLNSSRNLVDLIITPLHKFVNTQLSLVKTRANKNHFFIRDSRLYFFRCTTQSSLIEIGA